MNLKQTTQVVFLACLILVGGVAVAANNAVAAADSPHVHSDWWVPALMSLVVVATVFWALSLRRTAQRHTADLQKSEALFRSLVEKSLVGVYIIQDGRFAYANPRLAEIFGYTPEEMMTSCTVRDAVHPEDWPIVEEQIRKRLDGAMS
ncbi:MAG TPA: PAS domain S-box protein, partial [Verrucomicrobiota bacterium]|nr:PAS domain S-box protein [Verrucomicrobiota bacterium]